MTRICSIDSCQNKHRGHGYCDKHYEKWRRFGDPLHLVEYGTKTCFVSGCNDKHSSKGYCSKHYAKWKKYGDPLHMPNPKKTIEKMCLSHLGKKLSEEHKKNIGKAGKGRKHTEEARKNMSHAQMGHDVSEETRTRISKSNKNPSPKTLQKMSKASKGRTAWNKGKLSSEEHKKNMAKSRKGRKLSEEHKKNIGKAGKGRKHTEETIMRMIKAQTGKIISEDQKRKLSILYSTPEWKKIFRERLRKTRHNQQKPNQLELKIKKILTDAGLVFNPERNFDKFIQSTNKSNFAMLINVPFFHLDLQQEFKEADFLIAPNKIIEANGTYPHADPRKYPSNKKIWDKSAEEKWKLDEMILDSLKQLGYEVLVVWQLDLEKDAENTRKRILKFAKS